MPLSRRDLRALIVIGAGVLVGWPAWQTWRAGQLGEEIAHIARPHDLQMVSSETCVFCSAARHWLQSQRLPFDECFIERDAACMARYQAQGAPGTPLIFVRGRPQLGFSPERVRDALLSTPRN
jgi:glutaredoxin